VTRKLYKLQWKFTVRCNGGTEAFTCLSEALQHARFMLKQGHAVIITPLDYVPKGSKK
jgi:hypothetical protein